MTQENRVYTRKIKDEEWTLERFFLYLIASAYVANERKFPIQSFGCYNALMLYLEHSHYSPFWPLSKYCSEEERNKNIEQLVTTHPIDKWWEEKEKATNEASSESSE